MKKNSSSENSDSASEELPVQQEAPSQIDHLYYQACHCVCMAKQVSADIFHAIARCRSLLDSQVTALMEDPQSFATAREALERGRAVAMGWTLEHQKETRVPQ